MAQAILLTGLPGCGKTTLIRRLVASLPVQTGGFYTQEMREGGARTGFELVTLDGQRQILAHVAIRGSHRLGKYGVDLHGLESIGVRAMQKAAMAHALVVVDEIGPMEIMSPVFRRAILEILTGPCQLLGTIVRRSTVFTDQVKAMPNVKVIELNPGNREALDQVVYDLIMSGYQTAKL